MADETATRWIAKQIALAKGVAKDVIYKQVEFITKKKHLQDSGEDIYT